MLKYSAGSILIAGGTYTAHMYGFRSRSAEIFIICGAAFILSAFIQRRTSEDTTW